MTLDAAIDRIRLEGPSGSKIKEFADVTADFLSTAAGGAAVGGAQAKWHGGLTGEIIRSLADELSDHYVSVRNFGATGNNASADTAGFQAAAATGKHVLVPEPLTGKYLLNDEVVLAQDGQSIVGRRHNSPIRVIYDGIGIKLTGGFQSAENLYISGLDADISLGGNNAGAIGLAVVGGCNKTFISCVDTEYFTFAGLALAGAQNSTVQNCQAQYSLYNYLIMNATRNIVYIMCNSTDWYDEGAAWVTTWMKANDPNCRGVYIGNPSNSYITALSVAWPPTYSNTPSRIHFVRGLHERYDRHTNIIEIAAGWDILSFDEIELTRTLNTGKLFKTPLDQGTVRADRMRVLIHQPWTQQNAGGNLVNNGGCEVVVTKRDFPVQGDVTRALMTGDIGPFVHCLDAPACFIYGIGQWVTGGGSGSISYNSSTGRADISVGTSGPIKCAMTSNRQNYKPPTSKDIIKVTGFVDTISASIDIRVGITGSPFYRTVGQITTAGEFSMTYKCQGDEDKAALAKLYGTSGTATASLGYLVYGLMEG